MKLWERDLSYINSKRLCSICVPAGLVLWKKNVDMTFLEIHQEIKLHFFF